VVTLKGKCARTRTVGGSNSFDLVFRDFTSSLELLLSSVADEYVCWFDASAMLVDPSLGLETASRILLRA
jgi:hypothetical protein